MRRFGYIIAALLVLDATATADQGWQDVQNTNGFISAQPSTPFPLQSYYDGTIGYGTPATAFWSLTGVRVFAVNPSGGSDANQCWADSADATQANVAAATVTAWAKACATLGGASAELPPQLAGRKAYVVAEGNGTTYTDPWTVFDRQGGMVFVFSTGTNSTCGATAGTGTTADLICQGAQTTTGMNVAGYHPVSNATSNVVQLVKVGGGSPAFPAEVGKPLFVRLRGDAGNPTTATQNHVNSVVAVTAADTIQLNAAITYTTADTFYLEDPGAIAPGGTFSGNATLIFSGVQASSLVVMSGQQQTNFAFSQFQGTVRTTLPDGVTFFVTSMSFTPFPTVGPSRMASIQAGGSTQFGQAAGLVVGNFNANEPTELEFDDYNVVGGNAILSGGAMEIGLNPQFGGSTASTATSCRVLGKMTINGVRISLGFIYLPSTAQTTGVTVIGTNDVIFSGNISGGLKTNVGMDLSNSTNSRFTYASTLDDGTIGLTVTGANGDMYYGTATNIGLAPIYQSYTGFSNAVSGTVELSTGDRWTNKSRIGPKLFGTTLAVAAFNSSGVDIPSARLVRFGVIGDARDIAIAQADTFAHSVGAIGMSLGVIKAGQAGWVATVGNVQVGWSDVVGFFPGAGGWPAYLSDTVAGLVTHDPPSGGSTVVRQVGWSTSENEVLLAPDNWTIGGGLEIGGSVSPGGPSNIAIGGILQRSALTHDVTAPAGSDVCKVVGLTDSGGTDHPIGSMTVSQCMALDGSGNVITQACASGGAVSSVTGTAQRISATPTTGAVVVDTIGGFYSGTVSGGNEDLGTTLTNGLVCNDTTAGVAVLRSCVSGTDYQPATAKTCTGGQFLNEIDATGAAVCASPPAAGADALATYEVTSSSHIPANGVNLGALASGVNEQTTTAGVASPLTYQCVAGEVQFGAASGGGLAQSPNLFYATTGTLPQLGVGTSTPATGYSIDAKADATSGLVGLRLEVAGNTGNFNMAFDPITLGPYLVSHTDLANKSTLNAPGARLQFGGNGFIASASAATIIGAARTWNQGVQVNPSDGSVYFGLPSGHAVDVSMGSGVGTSDNHGFFFLETGNGPPTGTPAPVLGGNSWAEYIDRANFRFDVYDATNSRWETWGQNDGALSGAPGIIKTAATTGIHSIAVAGTDYQPAESAQACFFGNTFVNSISAAGVVGCGTPSAACAGLPALTGGVTSSAGSCATTVASVPCSALPALTGAVTSSAGSCSTTVNFTGLTGSLACLQRPEQLGDSTAPAGSCTTTNVAITETSGPQRLTFGAIPDSSPQSTVLIRPTGTNTVVGIAASLIADSVTKHDYFINEAVDAALYIGEWASTSNDNFIGTGITIEYPNDFKAGHIKGTMNLIDTIGIVSAAITCSLTLNGVAITSGGLSFTPSVTANGLYTTGTIATGSASANDTYGLKCSTSGSLLVGAQYDFSYQMVLTP